MQIVPEMRQSHANCTRMAANFGKFYSCFLRLAAMRVQFACDWRPFGYNLYATGGHSGTIYMRLTASCLQSRQFFASTLQEQLFELKYEDAIKNSENLHDT
jgi:hypothetical protein